MTAADPTITPDDKDWTWTLQRACPDCGFAGSDVPGEQVVAQIGELTAPWADVLARVDVRERPRPGVWSPLEYGAHVRDVCLLFRERLALMLDDDAPQFANWDQDVAAVQGGYAVQDPTTIAIQLASAASGWGEAYAGVSADQWSRPGLRSNGSTFTVLTLGQYGLHDLAHHLWDVGARTA
ncbi:MAG: DinB family protein [Nostocoides sp.]